MKWGTPNESVLTQMLVDCSSDAIIHLGLRRRFEGGILSGLTGMNLSNTSKIANL